MRSKHQLMSLSAASSVIAMSALISTPAYANCVQTGTVYACDTSSPNPFLTRVGNGQNDDGVTVIVASDAIISTTGTSAISLGDAADITVNGRVTNLANAGATGSYGTGANTIEFGGNGTLIINEGASVEKTGTFSSSEAINIHGAGNVIRNYGTVRAENDAAIWFQNVVVGVRNEVENFGVIERVGGGNVMGASAAGGIVFHNRTDAKVIGNLTFGTGDDDLYFYAGSLVTGSINGGGGLNNLTLQGAAASSDVLAGAITNFTTLTKDGEGLWTVSGSLTGFTDVTVNQGTLALTGNNIGYTGSVLINENGTLEARAQSLPIRTVDQDNVNNVENNGVLRFVQADAGTYGGQITGTGLVEKTGAGTLIMAPIVAGGNSYSGGTLITAGTLALGADNQIGANTGALSFNGGTLRFDDAFNLSDTRAITLLDNGGTIDTNDQSTTISQAITGAGSLTKVGVGTLTLSGANSFAGDAQVNAGTLYVNGVQTGTGVTTVASAAVIGGSGRVGGDLIIQDGATLTPGQADGAVGTFTVGGDLQLASGATLNYQFGAANVVGGPLNDLTVVEGDLVLDGTLNVTTTTGGTFGPGIYRVISYSGELTNNVLEIGTIPSPDFYVQTSVANQVNLINTAGLNLTTWDAVGDPNDGTVSGGTGVWQNSNGNENWSTPDGAVNAPWADDSFAVFTGAAGIVTIDNSLGDVTAGGMQFAVDGYVVEGDRLTLVGPESIIRVGDGTEASAGYTATIDSILTGETQIVKTDAGTLVLTATNTHTGGTAINGGTVAISNDAALGSVTGDLSFNGGTLRLDDALSIADDRNIVLNTGGGTIDTNGHSLTISQGITGVGGLTLTGGQTVTLTGKNVYEGPTVLQTGTLTVNAPDRLSAQSQHVTQAGTTLALAGHDQTIGGLTHGGLLTMGTEAGTTLTVDGDYVGNNGRINMNVVLGGDNSASDRLEIAGNTSGSSQISVTNLGGVGAPTAEGIKLVDVGGTSDGEFTLIGNYTNGDRSGLVTGAYVYHLYQNGVTDPTDGDWYLRSASGVDGRPFYQPAVPVHEGYAENLQALNELPTLQQRVGNRQWANGTKSSTMDAASGVWGRMTGTRARPNAAVSSTGADVNTDSWKAQLGVDAALINGEEGKALIAGVNGYYGEATSDISSFFGDGRIKTNGYGAGASLTLYGERGFYIDAQAQYSWFKSDLSSNLLGDIASNNDGRGQAYSVELGRRAKISDTLSITPQVQMVYSDVEFDSYVDPLGADVSSAKGSSLKSRWGLSLDGQSAADKPKLHYYAVANLTYEWLDGSRTIVSGASLERSNDRLWSELGLGATYSVSERAKLYFEAQGATSVKNFGDTYTLKGVAGIRIAM